MSFRFEVQEGAMSAAAWIGERLRTKQGGWVYGGVGTGKSHAIRAAIEGGIRVDTVPGPLLGQRFVADLARQIGDDGVSLLEAYRSEGVEAAVTLADRAINGLPFVVDGVDRLIAIGSSLEDPAPLLWQDEGRAWLEWLQSRLDSTPTFLVGRRRPSGVGTVFACSPKEQLSVRLPEAERGHRNWPLLGQLARNNPAVVTLGRAVVPLLSASSFNDLVEQAEQDGVTPLGLLQRLGQAFLANAPPSWQRVLSVVNALWDPPRDVVDSLWRPREREIVRGEDGLGSLLGEDGSALERLRELRLIEERPDHYGVLPALVDAGAIRPLTVPERAEVLPSVAGALLAAVNDPRRLVPQHASRVLRAHSIYVEMGDAGAAERTALLHVHGLVDLARRMSTNGDFRGSWPLYDQIFRMLESGSFGVRDRLGRRLLSYVRHYRARDGARAGAMDEAACLQEYEEALSSWPENALWHERVVETFLRLARPVEALQAVVKAYQVVEDHPRRDELLRVRPAETALSQGLPLLALELIEPVRGASPDLYPEVADGCRRVLRRFEQGVRISELPVSSETGQLGGRVVLHVPLDIHVRRRADDTFAAGLRALPTEGNARSPLGAVHDFARKLAEESRRLVTTPASNLGVKDVRLKGRLLSVVDALHSDIGIERATERWIVGRIQDRSLVPTMQSLPAIPIPDELFPEITAGLYFASVPVHRDGMPSGPATRLEPAGSGRDRESLLALLQQLSTEAP